jgi:hypothetical protein
MTLKPEALSSVISGIYSRRRVRILAVMRKRAQGIFNMEERMHLKAVKSLKKGSH